MAKNFIAICLIGLANLMSPQTPNFHEGINLE